MKSTITVDSEILPPLKIRAIQSGITLQTLVDKALRKEIRSTNLSPKAKTHPTKGGKS